MAMDVVVAGASLDTNSNIKVATPLNAAQAGYVILAGELAESTDPVGRVVADIRTSAQGRLSVGSPVIMLNEVFNGAAINSALFSTPVATSMTVAPAGINMALNASAITGAGGVARMTTYQFFPLQCDFSTFAVWEMLYTQPPQAGARTECGFVQHAALTAPTDGAFFRFDSDGTLKAIVCNNSVEQTTTIASIPSASAMHKYKIICENDRVLFYIDGVCVAIVNSATDMGMPMLNGNQPWSIRHHNVTAPSLASIVKLGYLCVGCQDAIGLGKPVEVLSAHAGKHGSQGQTGMTMGSTSNLTNSLALGAGVVLTNTTCANATLGGQVTIQPTLAAGTDGILFSYLVPIATTTLPGKTLYIRGVRLHGMVTAALTAGPGVLLHQLVYGHTGVTMATAEASNAATPGKAPRRIPLGMDVFAATAAIGTTNPAIDVKFNAPIAVNPGEYVAILTKFLAGTIFTGTTGLITYTAAFDSFWE